MSKLARDHRNKELAMIHIGKQQLAMTDEDYRAMLWACGRVKSSKDLDWAGRKKVIDHLKNCGFKVTKGRPHNINSPQRGPQLQKIEALLADASRPWTYADSMVRHMFQKDRVALCHEGELQKLIAALMIDQKRRAVTALKAAQKPEVNPT